ncbi:hypothetical protein RND81_01G155700 [Saponaria officinalis]|uniref:Chromatin structure-remodeling complex protein SYD-like n=1 Tax=Saponaria officinalis TaxID=3572 RepID=A0AAW1NER8_SAPOF
MAAPPNVEMEAAKFLQKLISDSTDEPARLATKLYVILQHMKASGKENSLPYQVISRAMETVINQHGLDIEALTSSRLPSSSGPQAESATTHATGSSQTVPATDSKSSMAGNDSTRTDGLGSCRPSAAPNSIGHDLFQGSVSQRSVRSFDHESPSSIDTKSTNSHSQDRRETASWEQQGAQKNPSRASVKRKKSVSSAVEPPDDSIQLPDSYSTVPDLKKERLTSKVEMPEKFPGVSESWKQGYKSTANFPETSAPGHLLSSNHANVPLANFNTASCSGAVGLQMGADRLLQAANPSNVSEVGALRSPANRDTGKASPTTNMPFKEHHLKQLRAQCLVFLAFRNGLPPKRLHLEIALGNILVQEGTSGSVDGAENELMPDKGKRPSTLESSCTAEASLPRVNPFHVKNERAVIGSAAVGCEREVNANLNEMKSVKTAGTEMGLLNEASHIDAEKHVPPGRGTFEAETPVLLTTGLQVDRSSMISPTIHSHDGSFQPGGTDQGNYVLGTNKPLKSEMTRWTGVAQNDFSRSGLAASIPHELGNRKDGSLNVSQLEGDILNLQRADSHLSTSWKAIQGDNSAVDKTTSITDGSKIVPVFDSGYIHRSPSPLGSQLEEEDKSVSAGLAPSSKQTLSEKWIMAHQKRKVLNEQKWVSKLQKADQRIECRFNELKETVTSAEDISTKTRSVIELKKLQLLELQRRLRRNIMNDFFKPVQSEMDQLKSIKKHRIGRRMKHVEKYEQKMKEERQKRIRERQKEFFSEIEVHKERLEDVFKFKRERSKGFVRFVKEFHKRKERIHREKIDRIQREKINLLKINDVEGYLRMVQDAKSDRVKQLLKETDKYLQKLGSKLQEAKTSAREVDIDENRISTFDESSENAAETEGEKDQAKHYKESNEKYYLIAHSIKESITEQPTGIQGGKLREYQMNGLRWLVSLYNNHLNGILADEMGLGKTVQVISLLCYLMEAKNDRGPFLVVVPSSVLPGWERELSFWAPGINKIVYTGPPEERRRLFKDCIVHQKFNVLLTTYEYLMNKHDRPKLSKIHWHYVIIDEGHRIKNASCKLNAELKHYQSSHRLLLTGTPLQNSLEELWALLNFLLPNIFNSSEDFSQWFNKPFEGSGDSSPDEALLSEEENLLIINRLHQVLRPFVLRRLKHKVENELPEKIERLVRCEASAYQKLLMTRVEENLGSLGISKGRAIHNTVMELRNICNHPYLSQLHVEEVDSLIPKHFLPPIIRLCGKLEMLDRLLPKLKETNHRVLFFSTMTRLLDVMEDYLVWKQYRYLRLDGHTSGQDRGALIEKFNQPDSPFFIFLLSIRAGGVGVNLQAADTVIIFDTDWNPQVDLQAQARAHRIGQKKEVLVLRLETVNSVEEQVRAAAEHKLGVANQSITAGFFDNNTSAEDRREYLESLLRESKKEEAAAVLDDDSLNDILARSEPEIAVFEAIDKKRREEEMATWKTLVLEHGRDVAEALPLLPSRLVTEDDLKAFYEAMKKHEAARDGATSSSGVKRKGGYIGGFDSQQYGRGKRAREVRSYEEQWSEEEFEKMCQSENPESIMLKDEKVNVPQPSVSVQIAAKVELHSQTPQPPPLSLESSSLVKEVTPPVKRGRGRPRRIPTDVPPPAGVSKPASQTQKVIASTVTDQISLDSVGNPAVTNDVSGGSHGDDAISLTSKAVQPLPGAQSAQSSASVATQPKRQGRKGQTCENRMPGELGTESIRRRGRKPSCALPSVPPGSLIQDPVPGEEFKHPSSATSICVNVSSKVTSENSSADGPSGTLPKCAEGSDILTLKDTKGVELAAKNNSVDMSLKAATSPTQEKAVKIDALSHSQDAPVQKHVTLLPVVAVENPKHYEQSVKHSMSDISAVNSSPHEPQDVNKDDVVSQGKVQSIAKLSAGTQPVSVGGSTPVSKAELHIDNPQPTTSGSEAQPSSTTPRTGRTPSQKPQNVAEPVRRRGRKRGISASADLIPPAAAQEQNTQEPLNTTGSAAVTGLSGSMYHGRTGFAPSDPSSLRPSPVLSGTAAIPSDTRRSPVDYQNQGRARIDTCTETTPRRRGRKKSTVSPASVGDSVGLYSFARQPDEKVGDIAEGKIITTRSRQLNISQPQSTQEDVHSADGIGKPLETRHTGTVEDIKQLACPADFPPISSKGKTNVIVLALDATHLDLDPIGMGDRNMQEKKPFSKLQSGSTPSASMLKPEHPRLDLTHAADIEVAKLDEELSAPPGFESSRPCLFNAAVTKSGEHKDPGLSSSPNAKMGSVVLALRSGSQTGVPTVGCQSFCAKDETSEVHSFKESGQATGVPPLPAATDKVMSCHPEEDMLAPPGFDIPQKHLSESVPANTLACEDDQTSDKLAESAVHIRVEEGCQGPVSGDIGHDTSDAPKSVLDSKTAAAVIVKEKGDAFETDNCNIGHDIRDDPLAVCVVESVTAAVTSKHEPVDTEQIPVVSATASVTVLNAAFPALELKEQEESHGLDSGDIGHDNNEAPLAVGMADSDTAANLTLQSREKLDNFGPYKTSAVETEEHEGPHCTDVDNLGHCSSDAPLAVCTPNTDTTAALTLELNENDQVGHGNTEENVVDASSNSVASLHKAVTVAIGSEVHGESHRPDSGHVGHDTSDTPLPVCVDSDTATTSELKDGHSLGPGNSERNVLDSSILPVAGPYIASGFESGLKGREELHGPGKSDAGHDNSDAPLAISVVDSDTAVAPTLKLKEKESVNNEQNMLDTSTASVPGPCSTATSALEMKEPEQSHGPDRVDIQHDTSDAPLVCLGDSDITVAQTLELREKSDHLGIKGGDIGHGTSDLPLAASVADPAADPTLTLELYEKGDHFRPDNSDQNAVDASITSVAGRYSAATSSLESKEQASTDGPACGDFGHDTNEDPLAVSVLDSDTDATVTLELKGEPLGPSNTEQNVGDTFSAPADVSTASLDDPCNANPSSLKLKEQEESPSMKGEHLGPGYTEQNVVDTSIAPVDISIASVDDSCNTTPSSLISKEGEESSGPGYTEQNVFDTSTAPVDVSTASVDDPCNTTSPSSISKEEKESSGPSYTEQNVFDTSAAPVDVSTASVDDRCNATPSSLISKKQEESSGPDYTEQTLVDTSTVSVDVSTAFVDELCNATPSSLKLKEQEESTRPGYTEPVVVDTSSVPVDVSTVPVDDPCNATPESLKSKEQEESPVDSDTAVAPTLGLNEKNHPEPDNTIPDGVNASAGSGSSPYNAAASPLESKEQEESHGPGTAERNVIDAISASVAASNTAAASALESKEQEESHGLDDCNVPRHAAGSPSPVLAGNDTSSALNPEPQEGELIHGPGSDLAENDVVSAMELKEEEKVDGRSNDVKTEDEGDNHPTSHVVDSDTVVEMTSKLKEKAEDKVGGSHTTSHADSDIRTEDAVGDNRTSRVVDSDTVVETASESIGKTEDEVVDDRTTSHVDSDGKTEDAVGDNPTNHLVDSDTVVEKTSEAKGKIEDEVGDDRTTSNVDSDGKTEDAVSDTVVEKTSDA